MTKRRGFLSLCTIVAAAALLAGCGSNAPTTTSPPPNAGPAGSQNWNVSAGASTSAEAVQALQFYPSSITIDAGDTVTWTSPTGEPHTVTLLGSGQSSPPPPTDPSISSPAGGTSYDGSTYTSSGFILGGQTYSLTFTKAGTYKVYSLTQQPEAVQTITVQAAGSPYPATASTYQQQAQAAEAADLAAGTASIGAFPYSNGGTHLAAGIAPGFASGPPATATVLRFLDANTLSNTPLDVATGTTVTWTNQSNNEPHDVVFPVAGSTPPPTLSPFAPSSGGTSYDGSTLVNSGVLNPGQSFSLTFTKAGTYQYYCLFHDDAGMVATITVH